VWSKEAQAVRWRKRGRVGGLQFAVGGLLFSRVVLRGGSTDGAYGTHGTYVCPISRMSPIKPAAPEAWRRRVPLVFSGTRTDLPLTRKNPSTPPHFVLIVVLLHHGLRIFR